MKTKKAISITVALCFIVAVASCDVQHTSFASTAQSGASLHQEGILHKKSVADVSSSTQGCNFDEMVVRHAKRMCNKKFYETFSQDGRDFIEFWLTADEVKLDLEKAYTCMRLFYNNSKSCELIDNTVVDQVSKVLPQIFEKYFGLAKNSEEPFRIIRGNIEDLMLESFTDRFDSLQTQPDLFISKLSADVTNLVKSRLAIIQEASEERELKEKLRNIIIRFLDMSINRIIWYEEAYRSIWSSFISIADNLHTIGKRGIINDQDNLDELWDSLVRRFVWYLDVKGSVLPVDFYEQIEEDLNSNTIFFLEIDEQDEGLRTKKDMIAEAIITAKAKAIAYERQGVISDQQVKV